MSSPATPSRSPFLLWLDLARAGNFPSVWSNVLAALALSAPVAGAWPTSSLLLLGFLAGSLAYAGGTTLNDVADAHFDAKHRPERAIPRGWVACNWHWASGCSFLSGPHPSRRPGWRRPSCFTTGCINVGRAR